MLNIAQVERETGLSKDVLRVWERRYGFPVPRRDDNGDRLYDLDQVARLRLVKRLIDQGYRPGKVLALPIEELQAMTRQAVMSPPAPTNDAEQVLERLAANDHGGLRQALNQLLARRGLHQFVRDVAPQLNSAVGEGWASGRLSVYQEHLYTEEISRALRAATAALPLVKTPPRILLTTVSGESHALGLLMAECLLLAEGAQCISLGPQTPMEDILKAASNCKAQVLALSFSIAFPARQGLAALKTLREGLADDVEIWAGGSMIRSLLKHALPNVYWTLDLPDSLKRLADWRDRHHV
jgi:DNA-binding transcriptional MerR regulator/methylmalonyl-CoA mutase cobalamin-binding subunit